MKKLKLAKKVGCLATFCFVGAANAAPVALDWSATVSSFFGDFPTFVGEQITTTITVDNGGVGTSSQTWTTGDFISYRLEGNSGWWFESNSINGVSGTFATDGGGNVVNAGNWINNAEHAVNTSFLGATTGTWFSNGLNGIAYTDSFSSGLEVVDVGNNQIGSSWTASSLAAPVPAPAALGLLGLGLAGVAFSRRKKFA